MRRLGTYTPLLLTVIAFAAPRMVFGAGFPVIIPQGGVCDCDTAPAYGCVLEVIQNLVTVGVWLGVTMCVVWLAYAGFMLMASGGNPEALSQAKTRIINALVGIVVILCAWITVDFIMKAIYQPEAAFDGQEFGPWNSILAPGDDDYCIKVTTPTPLTSGSLSILFGSEAGTSAGIAGGVGVAKGLCSDSNTSCSVSVLKAEGLTDAQAQAMSCIAVTESGGNPHTKDSPTGACGLFQITNRPGNWSNSAYHKPPCSTSSSCNNAACNRQTAVIMFKQQGYQPWTGKNKDGTHWNPNAVTCVAKYDPR